MTADTLRAALWRAVALSLPRVSPVEQRRAIAATKMVDVQIGMAEEIARALKREEKERWRANET